MLPRKFLFVIVLLLPLWAAAAPSFEAVRAGYQTSDAELLDRHGGHLQNLRIDMTVRRLAWMKLDDISPALVNAVLQAEDQRFYQHQGVDLQALAKAAWDNLFRARPRGASTITMQLAAMLNPTLQPKQGGRNLTQKWDQIQAARDLEKNWSKPQILEAYLNLVTFRGELQGIAAVSQGLFDKAPSGLDDVESLILGSLIRSPNAAQNLVARRACSLAKESGLAATCSYIQMKTAVALPKKSNQPDFQPTAHIAQKLLTRPAEKVISTLDAALQRFASQSVRQQLMNLSERNVNDGAVVVIDNVSGDVLAYVGNSGRNEVDGVVALRQAGSTLKPFLYELALEKKYLTTASILNDSPIDISTETGLYIPQNYDKDFKGEVSVRTSLASSLNVPAVRTLVLLGMDDFYNRLKELGLISLTETADYYGYSLALGSGEVSLLELTNAYRVLANNGLLSEVHFTPGSASATARIMDARASYLIQNILSDNAARSVTFGLNNELATPFWTAVKTGTSKDMRDNWCIGFSEKYTVGVWVGNFDGQPMWDVSGVTGAAPIWRDVMDYLHAHTPSHAPRIPAGVVARQINYVPQIEAQRTEWFIQGTESDTITLLTESKRQPKIRYPDAGSIIAIDPDIPEQNQRVFFQALAGKDLFWQLDGQQLGAASQDYSWLPTIGKHQLALMDPDGKVVDAIQFQVRGSASSAQ